MQVESPVGQWQNTEILGSLLVVCSMQPIPNSFSASIKFLSFSQKGVEFYILILTWIVL